MWKLILNIPFDQYQLVTTVQKTSPQLMTLPTAAAVENGGGVNRQTGQWRVVLPSALEAQRWETYNEEAPWRESREVTGCQGAVTTQDQDSLQQRKESGLLRSKSHHELLYRWGTKKKSLDFSASAFSKFYMLMILPLSIASSFS